MEQICYWDAATKTLQGSIRTKAKKFNREGCISQAGPGEWHVRPIEGYNHTTYTVKHQGEAWSCNCQFNQGTGATCSHIAAVMLWTRNQQPTVLRGDEL